MRDVRVADGFAIERLPAAGMLPDVSAAEGLGYPERLNAVAELLDRHVIEGRGGRVAIYDDFGILTYGELARGVAQRANLLESAGVVQGSRVLLRIPNNSELVSWWLAILRIGALAVTTAPLLRARELRDIVDIARPCLAIVDARLATEWNGVVEGRPETWLVGPDATSRTADAVAAQPDSHEAADTMATDLALLAFTSGTTGRPKATMHFHRDLLAIADCYAADVLQPDESDVFIGTPPLAFTFGLGALVVFPFRVGASTVLMESPAPDRLLANIRERRATRLFTAPTAYRVMAANADPAHVASLRTCVAAGETLPPPTLERWREATGLDILDGIGSTEMLHIFISARAGDVRPGSVGRPVRGYQAKIVDDDMLEVAPGTAGRLAVKGPTGCRYMDDPRQANYVKEGWNLTGDLFVMSPDGYFSFAGRADDMIVSSGYNIGATEVEAVLLGHHAVREVAVVGTPDEERGQIVTAFIVLAEGIEGSQDLVHELQDYVKAEIAPYKYPRAVMFVDELPKTATGKLQRFVLREQHAV